MKFYSPSYCLVLICLTMSVARGAGPPAGQPTGPKPPPVVPLPNPAPSTPKPPPPPPTPPPSQQLPPPLPKPAPPPNFPIYQPPPLSPIPPASKPAPAVKLTTAIKPPVIPKVMSVRSGNPAQVYLGDLDDMRDLEGAISSATAQYQGALEARDSYAKVFRQQEMLYEQQAISQEEFEQSRFDRDSAEANSKLYEAQIRYYRARHDEKEFQAKVAAKQVKFDLETFYGFYTSEWAAECEGEKYSLEAARVQLRLNRFVYNITANLYQTQSVPYYELEQRKRDLGSAEADYESKKSADATCAQGLPTLQFLKQIQESAPN